MVKGEFKETYKYWFVMLIVFAVIAIASAIVAVVIQAYAMLAATAICVFGGCFSAFYFLVLKKQYLTVSEAGLDCYVMTYKGARKPTKIKTELSFIIEAKTKGNILVLVNERGQDLSIYNLKNAKDVADQINIDLISMVISLP